MDFMGKMMDNRVLVLSGDIHDEAVEQLIQRINDYNLEDQKAEDTFKEFERQPILLLINSGGGSVYAGNALIGAIEMSETPIVTVALGYACSMAFAVLLAGVKRYAHRFTTLMYHQVSYGMYGKTEDHKRHGEHVEFLQTQYDSFVLERTNLTKDKLQEIQRDLREWYITPDEAVKLGVIDDII